MMKRFSFRYTLMTYRLDQLWLPGAFWALFVVISLFRRDPAAVMDMSQAYLGAVVPLVGGILAAYAVLDDPALELRFAAPTRAWQLLAERLGLILAVQTLCALSFQVFALGMHAQLSALGNWFGLQLAWFVPVITLMSVGCAGSLLAAQTMTGAFLTGLIWLIELLARGWLARNAGQYVLVFMGALMPDHPALHTNQVVLLFLSALFLYASWRFLLHQEKYI
jgi:hypothetical protein